MRRARRSVRARRVARGVDPSRGPLERQAAQALRGSARTIGSLGTRHARAVAAAAEALIESLENGGTVFFCGNGGSAADAQHMAAELAGRYVLERPPLAAIALSTNTSSLTAIANDYSFEEVFSRQLEGLAVPGDALVAYSTSGRSANVLRAVRSARALGMLVIGCTGRRGAAFAALCDHALVVPEAATPRVQEGHLVLSHALFELVEHALFGRGGRGRAAQAARKGARSRHPS